MTESNQLERHNINLSRQVWAELKLRAVQESASASELIAYVVEQFSGEYAAGVHIPRYQPRSPDEDRLGRTVFFPAETWQKAQDLSARNGTSIAGLIDFLLQRYLGMLPEPPKNNVVRIGEERVYLGESQVKIDWKTGKPLDE